MQSYAKSKNKTVHKHKERKAYVNQRKRYVNIQQEEFVTVVTVGDDCSSSSWSFCTSVPVPATVVVVM